MALIIRENNDDQTRSASLTESDLGRMDDTTHVRSHEPYSLLDGKINSLDEAMQAATFQEFKDRAEKAFIEEKLREQNWNISRTAEALDIQRSHLYTKMRKFGLMKDGRAPEIPPNEHDSDMLDEDIEDTL